MACFVHNQTSYDMGDTPKFDWCGTPACVLGNYASRGDLQRLLTVKALPRRYNRNELEHVMVLRGKVVHDSYDSASHKDAQVLDHFGITAAESEVLFGPDGCGGAKTPEEAAAYIEKFVAYKFLNRTTIRHVLLQEFGYQVT